MKRNSLTPTMVASFAAALAIGAAAFAGCADAQPTVPTGKPAVDDPTQQIPEQAAPYSAGEDNTHDHFNDLGVNGARDPFDILAQRLEEGEPEIRTRLHSCQKLQITSVRTVLSSLGVNLDATGDPKPAGQLLAEGTGALGAANYDGRVGESLVWSSAGAAKLFDVFVQAADEIIPAIETVDQCKLNGVGPKMFDDQNQCNKDAITCIIGVPATDDHVAICNNVVKSATDIEKGKRIAVATMLSAAFSCH